MQSKCVLYTGQAVLVTVAWYWGGLIKDDLKKEKEKKSSL